MCCYGCRPVQEIADRAKELGKLSQDPHLQGSPNAELPEDVHAAIMIEKVAPDHEAVVEKKAKDLKVTRVLRSGNALLVQPP